jgi:hypothetical protein
MPFQQPDTSLFKPQEKNKSCGRNCYPPSMASRADNKTKEYFDRFEKVMKMYSDNARTYIQLSGAALAFTLTFAHEILHIPKEQNIADIWMILMWGCFLAAIILGAFFQYAGAKLLEVTMDSVPYKPWFYFDPGTFYGVMLAAFYGGAGIFTIYAILRLRHP